MNPATPDAASVIAAAITEYAVTFGLWYGEKDIEKGAGQWIENWRIRRFSAESIRMGLEACRTTDVLPAKSRGTIGEHYRHVTSIIANLSGANTVNRRPEAGLCEVCGGRTKEGSLATGFGWVYVPLPKCVLMHDWVPSMYPYTTCVFCSCKLGEWMHKRQLTSNRPIMTIATYESRVTNEWARMMRTREEMMERIRETNSAAIKAEIMRNYIRTPVEPKTGGAPLPKTMSSTITTVATSIAGKPKALPPSPPPPPKPTVPTSPPRPPVTPSPSADNGIDLF